ncbi:hypothetical protein INT45_012576 [Circinella minor]|uniref:Uncharacterized protein n=1 Tax=Circinella minor TaxID=1195481 RepID=A0A8H7S0N2_9FUNG|nr:hypothetical protein INT45_012576 [Circinella minor]
MAQMMGLKKSLNNEDSRLPDEEDDDETLQEGGDNTTMITSDKFRSLIFEKGYKLFKEQLDLYAILEINTAKQNAQPSTLGEFLDHFSHYLIDLKQTTPIEKTLKLSLSRIIYLVGDDSVEVFQTANKHQGNIQYEGLSLKKPSLPPGMTTDMSLAYDEIVKYALLDQEVNDNKMMEMLDILNIVIASLPDRNRVTSSPVKLEMKDGETCSKATKEVRKHNACTYNDNDNDKKVIVGPRIDLLLSTMGVELGSSEWKKYSTSSGLGKQQRVKDARTNKTILRTLEKMSMDDDERDGLFVLEMDWIRQSGYMIAVKHVDGGYYAYHMGVVL